MLLGLLVLLLRARVLLLHTLLAALPIAHPSAHRMRRMKMRTWQRGACARMAHHHAMVMRRSRRAARARREAR